MRAFPVVVAIVCLVSIAFACGGGATSAGSTEGSDRVARSPVERRAVMSLLEAAGGDAAATVVFYPRHWPTFSRASLRIGGELVPSDVRAILSTSALWPALQRLAAEERIQLPRTLAGWDDSRPLVAALFESPELTVPELLAHVGTRSATPLLTHRLIVPASDPEALSRALVDIAHRAQCIDTPSELAGRVPDAPSVVCGGILAVFEPAADHVRVRIALLGDDAEVPPTIRQPLDSPVVVTPALRWTFEGPVVLAAHFRPAKVRAAALLHFAERIGRYGAGDVRTLIGAILRTSPVGAEVDDVAVGMATGNLPTFSVMQGLTEVGVAAYDAGLGAPVPPEGPADAPLVVRSRVNVDVMQAVAGVPLGLGGARSSDAALERVEACGEPCYLHMITSRVFGLGALSDQTGLLRELEGESGPLFRFEPAELADDVTMEMQLDFPSLARRMDGDREVTELAAAIGVAHAVQVRQGRNVMTTLRLGSTPPHPEIAPFAEGDRGAIGSAGPRDDGAACAEAILVELETMAGRSAARMRQRARDIGGDSCPEADDELRALLDAWHALGVAE